MSQKETQEKRNTAQPPRLTYTGLGQSEDVRMENPYAVTRGVTQPPSSSEDVPVSSEKSKATPSTVVSLKAQQRQLAMECNLKLQQLEGDNQPVIDDLKLEIRNLKRKQERLRAQIEAAGDDKPLRDKFNMELRDLDFTIEEKEDLAETLEKKFSDATRRLMRIAECQKEQLQLQIDEEEEQVLTSDDEAMVREWEEKNNEEGMQTQKQPPPPADVQKPPFEPEQSSDVHSPGYENFTKNYYDMPVKHVGNPGQSMYSPKAFTAEQSPPQYYSRSMQRPPQQPYHPPRPQKEEYRDRGQQAHGGHRGPPPPRMQLGNDRSDDVVAQLTEALGRAFGSGGGSVDKELPQFWGKAEEWPVFFNEFHRSTMKYKFQPSENAVRLRKALKGPAREAVVGLLDDPGSVDKIMQMLANRFGRSEFIIEALIKKVRECKSPEVNKPDTVVNFGTTVQHLVARVKSLQEGTYFYNMTLLQELVNKLPIIYAEQWINWLDYHGIRQPHLGLFGEWIEEKMNTMVRLCKSVVTEPPTDDKAKRGKRGSGIFTATVTEEKERPSEKGSCPYCKRNNHKLSNCWMFKRQKLDDRWKLVKDKKLCYSCLDGDHNSKSCKDAQECGRDGCKRKHHILLHCDESKEKLTAYKSTDDKPKDDSQKGDGKSEDDDAKPTTSNTIGSVVKESSSKPLSIVPIRVRGPKGVNRTFALLDSGANITAIDKSLANELGLNGKSFEHCYKGVGGTEFKEQAMKVSFEISGDFRTASYYKITDAVTVNNIGLDPYTLDVNEAKKKWPFLRRAKLRSMVNAIPKLIIGEDHPHITAHRELLERYHDEPMAKRTKLGWVIAGKKLSGKDCKSTMNVFTEYNPDALESMIKESFSLASFGVHPRDNTGSVEDVKALKILENTTNKAGEQWECGLLWREENVHFPPSKNEAMSRLLQNEHRMKRNSEYGEMYHAKMEEYLNKGFIRKLTSDEAKIETPSTYYIPHFGVYNVNKPGKLRLVFDAASKSEGVSLNDKLYTGPDLIRSLVSVLWNFRKHNVAITGDIEDMFHRVAIRQEDRNSQRFLWRSLKEAEDGTKPSTYVMNVMIFGACSSPSSAIFVKNKNAKCFESEKPDVVRAIIEDFYVDDCLTGAPKVEKAIQLREDITEINKAGGFHVKKWLSSSPEVIDSIPQEYRAKGIKDLTMKSEIPTERVLGLWWDPVEDAFTFKVNFKKVDPEILEGRKPTKREICSLVMSVYDPLGFVNNLKIKGMIILQMTWKAGIHWDDHVPVEIFDEWKNWLQTLKDIVKVKVPRMYCFDVQEASTCQLHTFVDASEEAYAAVSYLRIEIGGQVRVSFLSSKVRVAPLKKVTIPRMELLAAVLGTRLSGTITEELKLNITSKVYWSDSKTVLLWIKSESLKYREFVANRVGEIQESTNPSDWRWVPTALNIADEATSLKRKITLGENSTWLTGPDFLLHDVDQWPQERKVETSPEIDEELKPNTLTVVTSLGSEDTSFPPKAYLYSSYNRFMRATAAVSASFDYWKEKTFNQSDRARECPWKLSGETIPKRKMNESEKCYNLRLKKFLHSILKSSLNADDVERAELIQIKTVQAEAFCQELRDLKNGAVSKKSNIWKLSPFLDENNVMRVQGRIGAADTSTDVKRPIILPSRHDFTSLLIMREHKLCAHQGFGTVLNNLRQRFWIPEARATIRRVCSHCLECKIRHANPIIPKMGNLPNYRLAAGAPPFTHTGVDFFGPLEVTVGRHHEKRWGVVFTCMVTRAVHLDVAYGLSTDEMLLVLSRFVDCRGMPRHIYSDNGTNFVGAKKELKEAWDNIDWEKVKSPERFHAIHWHFIPALAPHMGGAWEPMVQSTKKILKTTLHEKYPKDQVLMTLLKGAENIINSRPLTYVSGDPADEESLTPNHFLRGFSFVGPSIPGSYDVKDEIFRRNWKRAQTLMEHFWTRWSKEYLPDLIQRSKWHEACEPLQVGDIVLLVDDQQPRNTWVKAVITAIFTGDDGQVRVVEVSTRDFDTKKSRVYRRSVDKVCPLGIRAEIQVNLP